MYENTRLTISFKEQQQNIDHYVDVRLDSEWKAEAVASHSSRDATQQKNSERFLRNIKSGVKQLIKNSNQCQKQENQERMS